MKYRCDMNNIIQTGPKVKKGDYVRVTTGPLANFIGHVEKLAEDQRVWVLMDCMQQKIQVDISLDDLAQT